MLEEKDSPFFYMKVLLFFSGNNTVTTFYIFSTELNKSEYFSFKLPLFLLFSKKIEQFLHSAKKKKRRRGDQGLDYNIQLEIGDLQVAYVNRFLWDITVSITLNSLISAALSEKPLVEFIEPVQ